MRTIEEISEDLSNLVYSKCHETTLNVLKGLKLKNVSEILYCQKRLKVYLMSQDLLNFNVIDFSKEFSDLLTDNILDNFNMSFEDVYQLLTNSKKLRVLILKELVNCKYF